MAPMNDRDDRYRDADLYDLEYADMFEDVAYYAAIAAQTEGPLLELACGTGRLTLPMSRTTSIVAVDRSPAMLDGCRRKMVSVPPSQARRIELLEGNFLDLRLGRTFHTVLWPFNALHHCRNDHELHAAIQTLAVHTAPGGCVAIDAYLPDVALYDRDPNERFEERTLFEAKTGRSMETWEQGWWDAETRTHHVVYHYQYLDGRLEKAHLRFTMWELPELHRAFEEAGFRLEYEASDFRSAPIEPSSLKWVATFTRP